MKDQFKLGTRVKHKYKKELGRVIGLVRDKNYCGNTDVQVEFDDGQIEYCHLNFMEVIPTPWAPIVGERVGYFRHDIDPSEGVVVGIRQYKDETRYDVRWELAMGPRVMDYAVSQLRKVPQQKFDHEKLAAQILNDTFDTKHMEARSYYYTHGDHEERLRYLERFVHGLKSAGVGGK